MKKIIITITVILINCNLDFSLDTVSTKFYPLKVGNSWTYLHVHVGFPSYSYKFKLTINSTIISGGHLYYISNSVYRTRVDSLYGRAVNLDSFGFQWLTNERLIDSLQARLNDSYRSECQSIFTKCIDTSTILIFGMNKSSKTFWYYDGFETGKMKKYIKDIGLAISFFHYGGPSYDTDSLKGCVIDNVLYGDTSIVGLQLVSKATPSHFTLSQNYPNPFNPVTNIKFQIAKPGLVRLLIFYTLGQEIEFLVNGRLKSGIYETEWNGENYPRGVYFYRLITESYAETKKMVLLK
jgi:hypothetical protein